MNRNTTLLLIVWNVALLGLALAWVTSGRVAVPWPFLVVAAASVLIAIR